MIGEGFSSGLNVNMGGMGGGGSLVRVFREYVVVVNRGLGVELVVVWNLEMDEMLSLFLVRRKLIVKV